MVENLALLITLTPRSYSRTYSSTRLIQWFSQPRGTVRTFVMISPFTRRGPTHWCLSLSRYGLFSLIRALLPGQGGEGFRYPTRQPRGEEGFFHP